MIETTASRGARSRVGAGIVAAWMPMNSEGVRFRAMQAMFATGFGEHKPDAGGVSVLRAP